MIARQAEIIAYVDDFKLLMIATLAVIPLLIVFKKAPGDGADHTVVVESRITQWWWNRERHREGREQA